MRDFAFALDNLFRPSLLNDSRDKRICASFTYTETHRRTWLRKRGLSWKNLLNGKFTFHSFHSKLTRTRTLKHDFGGVKSSLELHFYQSFSH